MNTYERMRFLRNIKILKMEVSVLDYDLTYYLGQVEQEKNE